MPQHTFYKEGSWNVQCDICGRIFKSEQVSKDWDNSIRCGTCLEGRHPQDFVRGVPDNQSVPFARGWNPGNLLEGVWINVDSQIVPWIGNGGNVVPWGN